MFKHLKNNRGDANVSKMVLIATVFVVGAILLVLITSAFRNPINRWFEKVSNDWFASENGEFNLMNNPFANYERNENGTYKGIKYTYSDEYGTYTIRGYDNLSNGDVESFVLWSEVSRPNGDHDYLDYFETTIQFSDDGRSIQVGSETFYAELP